MRRNWFRLAITLLAISTLSANSFAQDTLKLTLDQALEIAMSENLTVMVAEQEITKSGYAKKGAYAALYPQIELSGSYQRTIAKQTMYFADQAMKIGTDNTWSGGVGAGMALISPTLWSSLKISDMDIELSVEKARESKINLIDEVQQTYYGVLMAKASYNVLKENYDNAVRNYNDIKAKYNEGRVSKYDMITAEVNVKNSEPSLYEAQNNITLLLWKLKAVIGLDLNQEISCLGELTDYKEMLTNVTTNTEVSLAENTTLKQLEMQLGILDQTYKTQLAQYYPSLDLSFAYQFIAMSDNFKFSEYMWNPYSVGGLTLTIPIFSGGQRKNALKQTKVQQEQLKLQTESAARDLEVAVKQTLSSMETSIKQYDAALSSIEGAQAGYEISEKRYEVGSGTILEMDSSRLALLNSKLNLYQSVYSYLVGKSSLEKIIGDQLVK